MEQEKLFSEREILLNKRPRDLSNEQKEEFFKSIAEEIIANKWSSSPLENIMEDFQDLDLNQDGYDIAKELDRTFGLSAYYDIDTFFVEYLDSLYGQKYDIIRKNLLLWEKTFNIQPLFKDGQKLIIEKSIGGGTELKEGDIIFVKKDDYSPTCYSVSKEEDSNHDWIIEYERIESSCREI